MIGGRLAAAVMEKVVRATREGGSCDNRGGNLSRGNGEKIGDSAVNFDSFDRVVVRHSEWQTWQ